MSSNDSGRCAALPVAVVADRTGRLATALSHPLGSAGARRVVTTTYAELAAGLAEHQPSLVVALTASGDATADVVASAEAVVGLATRPAGRALRVVVVHLCRPDDETDPERFWLRGRVRAAVLRAAPEAETNGVNLVFVSHEALAPRDPARPAGPDEQRWVTDVAGAVEFLDRLGAAVAVPELALSR